MEFQNIVGYLQKISDTKYSVWEKLFGVSFVASKFVYILAMLLLFYIVFIFYRDFFYQGSCAIIKNINGVIKNGVFFYIAFLAVAGIFVLSVAGYGIGVFVILIMYLFVIMGMGSLCLAIGKSMVKNNILSLLVGIVIIEVLRFVPYWSVLMDFVILPIICLGVVAQTVINLYINGYIYEKEEKNYIDKQTLYSIITGKDN